jgi:hypothetical protein
MAASYIGTFSGKIQPEGIIVKIGKVGVLVPIIHCLEF